MPDLGALASLVPALVELVESARIRILDLVALEKDADGAVTALEVDAVDSISALLDVDGEVGGMLSEHDIELAALALRPRTAGIVLVTEDRWAEPLSIAAQQRGWPDHRWRAHPGGAGPVGAHPIGSTTRQEHDDAIRQVRPALTGPTCWPDLRAAYVRTRTA